MSEMTTQEIYEELVAGPGRNGLTTIQREAMDLARRILLNGERTREDREKVLDVLEEYYYQMGKDVMRR